MYLFGTKKKKSLESVHSFSRFAFSTLPSFLHTEQTNPLSVFITASLMEAAEIPGEKVARIVYTAFPGSQCPVERQPLNSMQEYLK